MGGEKIQNIKEIQSAKLGTWIDFGGTTNRRVEENNFQIFSFGNKRNENIFCSFLWLWL